MMKKEYKTPELIIRRVILESMIALSTDPTPSNPIDADARENDDWDDNSDNIWED